MFPLVRKFFVYIEIIPELKNAVMGQVVENSIIHINTFIKICSINSFESWLLVIRLVDRCVPFLSTLQKTLLPQPPVSQLTDVFRFFQPSQRHSCLNLPISFAKISPNILRNLEEIYSFQYFFGRSCYYYQISHRNTTKKRPY